MNKPEFLNQGTKAPFSARYDNFIGGQWVAPVAGRYFENTSPITGRVICEVARSDAADVDKALDAAHAAKEAWGRTAPGERARILNKIADRMEENLDLIALADAVGAVPRVLLHAAICRRELAIEIDGVHG